MWMDMVKTDTPWWNFPAGPDGPPRHQHVPGACYQQQVLLNGETFGQPVMCGPLWSQGHVFTGSIVEAWMQWSWGSEDNP